MRDRESASDSGETDGRPRFKRVRAVRRHRLEVRRMKSFGSNGGDHDPKRARIETARPACKPVEVEIGSDTGSSDLLMSSSSSEEDLDRIFRAGGDFPIGILVSGGEDAGRRPCRSHGSVSLCGRRREMEDALTVAPGLVVAGDSATYDFFGVYDGHGGALVAQACRERLHRIVASEVERRAAVGGEVDWKGVMEACFAAMDGEIVAEGSAEARTIGSTAVVAMVGMGKVVVANCGDSRAVLSRGGVAVPLSRDHKPDRPDEMERVEAAGGRVINWDGYRVLGVLATSRSIGDHYLKPFVISEPEVVVTHRTDADEFLILASDGLWDVVPNDMACAVTRRCLYGQSNQFLEGGGGSTGAAEAAALLSELAMGRGSRDNISVVVVELRKTNSR